MPAWLCSPASHILVLSLLTFLPSLSLCFQSLTLDSKPVPHYHSRHGRDRQRALFDSSNDYCVSSSQCPLCPSSLLSAGGRDVCSVSGSCTCIQRCRYAAAR